MHVSAVADNINEFVKYARTLKGDEKGEAQVFCDRLFKAFGHPGYKEAGATLEFRIKKESGRGTQFADLVWKPRLLLEMKKGGEKLHLHYRQAFDYWINAVPNRPRHVVLSNFHEFWIYDFDKQLDEPVDTLGLDDLPKRYTALNFLFPDNREPIFGNDREAVSRRAADQMAELFKRLNRRMGEPVARAQAQRFVLQAVVAMFAEDIDLLPSGTVQSIVNDCLDHNQSPFDLFGGLFRQMNSPNPATAGRFRNIRYFNGGLFSTIEPIDLKHNELDLLGGRDGAASKDWSKVNPAIFGTLFQHSMDAKERHALGAHFTSEADIQRIVGPTIVRPWRQRIDAAKSGTDLLALRRELAEFRVLDPACGSGNFLYVAFRELARLDLRVMTRLKETLSLREFQRRAPTLCIVTPRQFYGIELDPFGVELAKVTLMLAKKLALDDAAETLDVTQEQMALGGSDALPLDNLDDNVRCQDALFVDWPESDVIVGNPPYQSKNKMVPEFGSAYVNKLRDAYPDMPGRADYCVYWFRRAHDHLKSGQRAGLVGTNTIRQNYSREGGLDYIVANGGTITEAVSNMIWPGEAVVHVSIVNWIKGRQRGKRRLYTQEGNDISTGWRHQDLEEIGPALSFDVDVTQASTIEANAQHGCHQGQTHGHEGFLIQRNSAQLLLTSDPALKDVLFPFIIADDLIGERNAKPSRYVIDFGNRSLLEAQHHKPLFDQVQRQVLPTRKQAAEKEAQKNREARAANPNAKQAKDHAGALETWWQLFRARGAMLSAISALPRYIVCGRVTKRPIFEFLSPDIHPNDALQVFSFADDYSFGVLQSDLHWLWFVNRCSTLKSDFRYTSNTVFDTFPWPQIPSAKAVRRVADAAIALRQARDKLRTQHNLSFRELYRSLELPGQHPLKDAHAALDEAVAAAYGMPKSADPLAFLLALNATVVKEETAGNPVEGPGLPSTISDSTPFITTDCISP